VVLDEQQDHRGVDHQPVCQRIEDAAEVRLHLPAPREEAVDLVGDAGDPEHDKRVGGRLTPDDELRADVAAER
jgi:hypothetical protein